MGRESNAQSEIPAQQSVAPHALALFRILIGAVLVSVWTLAMFQEAALSVGEWMLCIGMVLMAVFIIIGAWLRYIAAIMALLYVLEFALMQAAGTETNLVTNVEQAAFFFPALLLLAWSNADRAFSHAMHLRYGSALEWEDVRALPVNALKILVASAYLYIGTYVLWQPVWMSGVRLRSALLGSLGTKLGAQLALSAVPPWLFQWKLYSIKAFVLMLPFCLWIRSVRALCIGLGLILHMTAVVLIGKWWLLALASGMALFIDPEKIRMHAEARFGKKTA